MTSQGDTDEQAIREGGIILAAGYQKREKIDIYRIISGCDVIRFWQYLA
jgi:hypothetical protein